ncbi:uncharacterized protein [Anoplolepis gracilipes]|uniref:uncharacterized protein n=1 Tax=Anoplolepis gracilipes TaxID=354296 RepID=UPI003BA1EC15
MNKVVSSLNVYKRYYWTDSKIVLVWLNSPARRWKTFVSNRISEIQGGSSPSEWRHVKSKENPADLISRSVTPEKLKNSDLWWKGPPWLNLNKKEWPSEGAEVLCNNVPDEREKIVVAGVSTQESIIQYERYSSLGKLLRVIVYILRFSYNTRCSAKNRELSRITIVETNKAQLTLAKIVQEAEFELERKDLRSEKNVSKGSKLISLNPYLDSYDVLRVRGRLENSQLPEETKHPIILPSSHPVTILIIREKHEKSFHADTQATLAFVRQEFWPLAARAEVKKIIKNCVRCIKASPTPCQQIIGQLPGARVNPDGAFYNTGVDYCGPFFVRDRVKRNSKKYKA